MSAAGNDPGSAALPPGAVRRRVERRGGRDQAQQVDDAVAEEIPVAFVYNGRPHAVMLATPADYDDFALGFSLSEAIIERAGECTGVDVVPALAGIELCVTIPHARADALDSRVRQLTGRTGCGLCGAQTLEAAVRHPPPVAEPAAITDAALQRALAGLQGRQSINAVTGATHAAAWAGSDGVIALVREDVGRHNALDKLIGAMQRDRCDPQHGFVVVTSRASYEMVMKSATVGIGLLVAISAPTALAIALAHEANVTLAGFARGDGFSIYSHPRRILGAMPRNKEPGTMNAERLVAMANDIANFFAAEPDRTVAVEGVLNHLRKFWEPRMRRRIVAHLQDSGGSGLGELARAAVERLGEIEAQARPG